MSEKTIHDLELELAEERGRRKALEEQLAAIRALQVLQPYQVPYVPQPAPTINPYPIYPPTIVPQPWWGNGTITVTTSDLCDPGVPIQPVMPGLITSSSTVGLG